MNLLCMTWVQATRYLAKIRLNSGCPYRMRHRSQQMTDIQLTNVQFAQLQIDNLVAKDKPYIETWSAGDVGSFNAILNAVDYDNEFTYHMRGWSRQRVKSGTGGIITVDESNADKLYHLFTCYLSKLPSGVVMALGEVS